MLPGIPSHIQSSSSGAARGASAQADAEMLKPLISSNTESTQQVSSSSARQAEPARSTIFSGGAGAVSEQAPTDSELEHMIVTIDTDQTELDTPAKLRAWNIAGKLQRGTDTKDAQMMTVWNSLSGLNSETFQNGVEQLRLELSPDDQLRGALDEANSNMKESLSATEPRFNDFVKYKKFLKDATTMERLGDVRGNLFGSSPQAAIPRAVLGGMISATAGSVVQAAAIPMLAAIYQSDPSQFAESKLQNFIDQTAADGAQTTATPAITEKQMEEIEYTLATMKPSEIASLATMSENDMDQITRQYASLSQDQIKELANTAAQPASEYFEEANSTTGQIISSDFGATLTRATVIVGGDAATEEANRAEKLKSAMQVDKPSPGKWDKAKSAMANALKPQAISAGISVLFASLVVAPGQAARGVDGAKIAEGIGKAAGYGALGSSMNIGIDGLRMGLASDDWSPNQKQAAKSVLRTAGLLAVQYMKTAISLATAPDGTMPGPKIWNTNTLMTGGLGMALKSASSAALMSLTEQKLPPDDKLANKLADPINKAAKLNAVLKDPKIEQTLTSYGKENLASLRESIDQTLDGIREAAAMRSNSPGIQTKWAEFKQLVDDGPESERLQEVVIGGETGELEEIVISSPPPQPSKPAVLRIDIPEEKPSASKQEPSGPVQYETGV